MNDDEEPQSGFMDRNMNTEDVKNLLMTYSVAELTHWRFRLAQIDALIVDRLSNTRQTK